MSAFGIRSQAFIAKDAGWYLLDAKAFEDDDDPAVLAYG